MSSDAAAETSTSDRTTHRTAEVTVSEEQVAPVSDGLELCYQTFGEPTDRPLLLVMGLGGPMTWWPADLCRQLAGEGFFVIRYDNRDTGRSTRLRQHRVSQRDLVRAFLGRRVEVPYSLRDMARDGIGLLDHLGIDAAHVAGVSMGGMIAQWMVIEHPQRVLSLTSIMSTTGRRTQGFQHPMLLPALLRRTVNSKEEYVEGTVKFSRLIGSPGYPDDEDVIRARAEETWERGVNFKDTMRHMIAVVTQRDRTRGLRRLDIPVTVVHGRQDKMVHVSGGRATAAAIPGARLVLVAGMGHDLPRGLFDTFVEAISSTADRAK
jgi:pimeloyl-ACP methyl ester carboxylesterase